MITLILHFASDTNTYTKHTHTEATQVSHVLVPQYERKIPSGTGSPVWLHPSPHPGMITRMGNGALDFLQHVHSLMPAHSPTYEAVPTFRGKSLDPTGTSELQSSASTYGKREGGKKTSGLTITCLIFTLPLPFVFLFICALKCCASWNLRSGCTYFVLITNFLFV